MPRRRALVLLLVVIALVAGFYYRFSRTRSLDIGPETTIEEAKAFPTARQYDAMHARLGGLMDAVLTAHEAGDWLEYSRHTGALLLYSNTLPTFLVESYAENLQERIEANGLDPFLSFYVDFGRRLECEGSPAASRYFNDLMELYERRVSFDPKQGAPVVLLRESCFSRSPMRLFSSNVGWAVASIVYSEFGKSFEMHGIRDLRELLQLVQHATEASSCLDGQVDGATASLRSGPQSAWGVIGSAMAAGMENQTEKTFCDATDNLKGNGVGGLSPACTAISVDMAEQLGFPAAKTTFDQMQMFNDYVACMNREFNPDRQWAPYYRDMAQYFSGGDEGLSKKYGTKVDEDAKGTVWQRRRGGTDREITRLDRNNQVVESIEIKENIGGVNGATRWERNEADYKDGKMTGYDLFEELSIPNENAKYIRSEVGPPGGGECTEKYYKTDKDGKNMQEISKEEYEKKKKEYFPPPPSVRPGPEDPGSACDAIMSSDYPPILPQDIDELINVDPYEAVDAAIQGLRGCLADFNSWRACHTQLLCLDDRGETTCTCPLLNTTGPKSQCPYIQCPSDQIVVGCMCQTASGGFLPGLGGPVVRWTLPDIGLDGLPGHTSP